jgi:hypothetical protein
MSMNNRVPNHERLIAALQPGRHSITMNDLVWLLRLDLIEPTRKTPDGKIICYSPTHHGRRFAKIAGMRS